MFAKIGAAPHLFDPKCKYWLPPIEEYSKCYQLAFLTDRSWIEAIESKKLSPKTTQVEAAKVKKKIRAQREVGLSQVGRGEEGRRRRKPKATRRSAPAHKFAGALVGPHRVVRLEC